MTATTTSRDTEQLGTGPTPDAYSIPMAGATTMLAGTIGCVNASGLAVPGATATTLRAAGRVRKTVINSGSASAKNVEIEPGVFKFANSTSSDEIVQADVLLNCFIVDNQTVAKTDGGTTRSIAGKVIRVDSDGVFVQIGT